MAWRSCAPRLEKEWSGKVREWAGEGKCSLEICKHFARIILRVMEHGFENPQTTDMDK